MIEHELSYVYRTVEETGGEGPLSDVVTFMAEIDETRARTVYSQPITGRLDGATTVLIKSRKGMIEFVGFKGRRYVFSRLDDDGTFELSADGW